jgi:hypothetical protein
MQVPLVVVVNTIAMNEKQSLKKAVKVIILEWMECCVWLLVFVIS